ncbi:MAG: GFA family protein [Pseudomonadota bacterium]
MPLGGSCLCGSVAFEVATPIEAFTYCYCLRCRKATGADRAAVLIVAPAQLTWLTGESAVRRWDLPSADSFATAVCSQCGCAVPRLTRDGRWAVVPAGALDTAPPSGPTVREHWASRAPWVCDDGSPLPFCEHDAP